MGLGLILFEVHLGGGDATRVARERLVVMGEGDVIVSTEPDRCRVNHVHVLSNWCAPTRGRKAGVVLPTLVELIAGSVDGEISRRGGGGRGVREKGLVGAGGRKGSL